MPSPTQAVSGSCARVRVSTEAVAEKARCRDGQSTRVLVEDGLTEHMCMSFQKILAFGRLPGGQVQPGLETSPHRMHRVHRACFVEVRGVTQRCKYHAALLEQQ